VSAVTTKKVSTLNIEALDSRKKYHNILIYGESGVGKTTFASTAPRPILWLEAEGGTHSIGDPEGIDIARVNGLEDYREALRFLHANPGKYETVVVDSITETQAAILKEIMRAVKANDPTRDEFQPLFSEWGKVTGVMREITRAFRDLPANTILTALTREDKDDLTGRMRVRPRLSPALAEEVPAFMDAVIYLYTATPKKGETNAEGVEGDEDGMTIIRNGLLQPTGKYAAKLRAPKGKNPPNHLSDPTFDAVVAFME
jgi:phage nucleotide-binding protein